MKKTIAFVLLAVMLACKKEPHHRSGTSSHEEENILHKIALANGLEVFEDIEKLEYTFNVEIDDSLVSSRSWQWLPQTQQATLKTTDSTITYNYHTEKQKYKEVDQKFINDQYWLLFPFHLVWDDLEYEHHEKVKAPMSNEEMHQLVITYPQDAGYTPGDVYEIFFDEDYIIREWIYLSGGSKENPLITSWEDYQNIGGIQISKMHRNPENNFELFFTEVEVEK